MADAPALRKVADTVEIVRSTRGPFAPGPAQFERRDPVLHHQLGFVQPALAPAPPAAPPPSEPALRQQLALAVGVQRERETALAEAEAAFERAVQNLEECRARLHEFADLDTEIAEHTAQALRLDKPTHLPNELHERNRRRAGARAAIDPAESALATLRGERDVAAAAAAEASASAHRLAVRILVFKAEAMAAEVQQLQVQIQQRQRALLGFDRATVGVVPLPMRVRDVLGDNISAQQVAAADPGPWKQAVADLLADPTAEPEITLPVAVKPPLLSGGPPPISIAPPPMQDDGDPGLVPVGDDDSGSPQPETRT